MWSNKMIIARLPDGSELGFPDNVSEEQMDATVKFYLGADPLNHEAQEKAMDAAKWNALLQGLDGVQQMLAANAQATQAQTAAISAPKTVVRDPNTGLVQSLVTGV